MKRLRTRQESFPRQDRPDISAAELAVFYRCPRQWWLQRNQLSIGVRVEIEAYLAEALERVVKVLAVVAGVIGLAVLLLLLVRYPQLHPTLFSLQFNSALPAG